MAGIIKTDTASQIRNAILDLELAQKSGNVESATSIRAIIENTLLKFKNNEQGKQINEHEAEGIRLKQEAKKSQDALNAFRTTAAGGIAHSNQALKQDTLQNKAVSVAATSGTPVPVAGIGEYERGMDERKWAEDVYNGLKDNENRTAHQEVAYSLARNILIGHDSDPAVTALIHGRGVYKDNLRTATRDLAAASEAVKVEDAGLTPSQREADPFNTSQVEQAELDAIKHRNIVLGTGIVGKDYALNQQKHGQLMKIVDGITDPVLKAILMADVVGGSGGTALDTYVKSQITNEQDPTLVALEKFGQYMDPAMFAALVVAMVPEFKNKFSKDDVNKILSIATKGADVANNLKGLNLILDHAIETKNTYLIGATKAIIDAMPEQFKSGSTKSTGDSDAEKLAARQREDVDRLVDDSLGDLPTADDYTTTDYGYDPVTHFGDINKAHGASIGTFNMPIYTDEKGKVVGLDKKNIKNVISAAEESLKGWAESARANGFSPGKFLALLYQAESAASAVRSPEKGASLNTWTQHPPND